MSFQYGCFISYAADEGEYMKKFMFNLISALRGALGPYLDDDEKLYIDESSLTVGRNADAALADGLCRSACWLMVYVPKYRRRSYCVREYAGMLELREHRRQILGDRLPRDWELIVPLLLKGPEQDLPASVQNVKRIDFRKFSLLNPAIARNRQYNDQIEELAEHINDVWELGRSEPQVAQPCDGFELPSQCPPGEWDVPERGGPNLPSPGRAVGP
jgi:hypothetical protein